MSQAPLRAVESASALLRGQNRVLHQHRHRHRTDSARNRSYPASFLASFIEVDIANKPRPRLLCSVYNWKSVHGFLLKDYVLITWNCVDATINNNSTRFDPVSFNHLRLTNTNYEDIGSWNLGNTLETKDCDQKNYWRTTLGKFFVLLWHTVTVALCHLRSSAIGVPTILLRPKTTAWLPSIRTPDLSFKQSVSNS